MFRIWPPLISSPGPRRRNQGRPNPEHGYRERLSRFGKEAYSAWAAAERRCARRLQSPTSVILHEFVAVAVGISVARYPPHRPVLARLTHTVPPLDGWRQSVRWDKDVGFGPPG